MEGQPGLGGDVLIMGTLRVLGPRATCQEVWGRNFFSGEWRGVPHLTPCTPPHGPLGPTQLGLVAGLGFGPPGSSWSVGCEGSNGPLSVPKPRWSLLQGLDPPLRFWATGPGAGEQRVWEERRERLGRRRTAGTQALAPEQSGRRAFRAFPPGLGSAATWLRCARCLP